VSTCRSLHRTQLLAPVTHQAALAAPLALAPALVAAAAITVAGARQEHVGEAPAAVAALMRPSISPKYRTWSLNWQSGCLPLMRRTWRCTGHGAARTLHQRASSWMGPSSLPSCGSCTPAPGAGWTRSRWVHVGGPGQLPTRVTLP
jgi:hypothetical protein